LRGSCATRWCCDYSLASACHFFGRKSQVPSSFFYTPAPPYILFPFYRNKGDLSLFPLPSFFIPFDQELELLFLPTATGRFIPPFLTDLFALFTWKAADSRSFSSFCAYMLFLSPFFSVPPLGPSLFFGFFQATLASKWRPPLLPFPDFPPPLFLTLPQRRPFSPESLRLWNIVCFAPDARSTFFAFRSLDSLSPPHQQRQGTSLLLSPFLPLL